MPLDSERNTFRDDSIHGLSTSEVTFLRRFIHQMQQQVPSNHPLGSHQPTQQYTPYILPTQSVGCYVAQAPVGGIPYAVYHRTGTGLPTHFTPGAAECQIYYHEVRPSVASGTLSGDDGQYVPADDVTNRVFNTLEVEIAEGTYVPIIRDADGNWITCLPQPARGVTRLFDHTDTIITTSTTEADLYVDSIPAGTLNNDGDVIEFKYAGGTGADPQINFRARFAGSEVARLIVPTGIGAGGSGNYSLYGYIIRVSNTTVRASAMGMYVGSTTTATQVSPYNTEITGLDLDAMAYDMKHTADKAVGSSGAIFAQSAYGEKHPV